MRLLRPLRRPRNDRNDMKLNKNLILIIIILLSLVGIVFYKKIYPRLKPHPVIPPRPEVALTIIPGWNLRQVADYLVTEGFATSTEAVYSLTGEPATIYKTLDFFTPYYPSLADIKRPGVSLEGYLAPETVRVFTDSSLVDVVSKFVLLREKEITPEVVSQAHVSGYSLHKMLTMASIIEKEVKFDVDRPIVADILLRRVKLGWALQVDSSVHYAVDKTGTVYTTDKERQIDSLWNTYKYAGLPPGPICNPSLESIKAALNPEANDYWYFLSGKDGKIYYAKTLEEHNLNKKYL